MNREMLPEARVAHTALQFGFGPGALLICGRVWWERQRCAVQVQEADEGDQFAGIEIFPGPLGEALQIVATSPWKRTGLTPTGRESLGSSQRLTNAGIARSVGPSTKSAKFTRLRRPRRRK